MFDPNQLSYPRVEDGVVLNGPEDWPPAKLASLQNASRTETEELPDLDAGEDPAGINVNSADEDELRGIKGVGKKTAGDIVAAREADGPFVSLNDLADRVGGVSLKQLQAAGAYV